MLFSALHATFPQIEREIRWHIHLVEKIRVYVEMTDQPSALRICSNIDTLIFKIILIAYAMLMETRLPYFSTKLFSHVMRKSAFDALYTTLDGLPLRRCQQYMNVLRHDGKSMQQIPPLIAMVKESIKQQISIRRPHKKRTALVCHSRNGICGYGRCLVDCGNFENSIPQGLKARIFSCRGGRG